MLYFPLNLSRGGRKGDGERQCLCMYKKGESSKRGGGRKRNFLLESHKQRFSRPSISLYAFCPLPPRFFPKRNSKMGALPCFVFFPLRFLASLGEYKTGPPPDPSMPTLLFSCPSSSKYLERGSGKKRRSNCSLPPLLLGRLSPKLGRWQAGKKSLLAAIRANCAAAHVVHRWQRH